MGKGENAGYCIFSFSHNEFKRPLIQGRSKSGFYGKELIDSTNFGWFPEIQS